MMPSTSGAGPVEKGAALLLVAAGVLVASDGDDDAGDVEGDDDEEVFGAIRTFLARMFRLTQNSMMVIASHARMMTLNMR
jgi:hypothetical protein